MAPATRQAPKSARWQFPALAWLEELTARFGDRVVFVYAPTHIASQPRTGSVKAAKTEACKARISTIARRHNVPFVDFSIRSEITANDDNW